MKKRPTLLFLGLSIFDTDGGIQQVCRSLSYTLTAIALQHNLDFQTWSLHDKNADPRYIEKANFRGFQGNWLYLILKLLSNFKSTKTIFLGHIHLLPIAILMKIFRRDTEIIMLAHGVEIWRELKFWQRYMLKNEITIWSVSNFTRQKLITQHKIEANRIHVLNNSIAPFFSIPNHFHKPRELLKRYGLKQKAILLSLTRMTKQDRDKGYDLVLNSIPWLLSKLPNLHYLIGGASDMGEKNRLKSRINDLNIHQHVTLLDFIPPAELTAHLLLADLFILPSKKEGFGIAFIEAAACGRKIISGNADGSVDALLNGQLGCMVNPNDSIQIREAILQNLQTKPSYNTAKYIQRTCLKHFGHQTYARKVEYLLKQTSLFK